MIDVHSHILFGVDDGPSCIEQSVEMLKEAQRIGIRSIIASPHYNDPIFNLSRAEENYKELVSRAKEYDVTLYMSCEVFINPDNPVQIRNRREFDLNRAGIIIFEFPFGMNSKKCIGGIHKISLQNVMPVIAHVERNRSFINDFSSVVSLIKAGYYIQVDAASIVGVYGSRIKEYSKKLIQMGLVDMVASNAHCVGDYANWFREAYRNVSNWIGNDEAGMLFLDNAKNLLEYKYVNKFIEYKSPQNNSINSDVHSVLII